MSRTGVRFHPEAQAEYLDALRWYRERSSASAVRLEAEVTRSVEKIRQAPERWARYFEEYRRFLLHQFPFEIAYESSPHQIFILAIAHTHRRPGYWKTRL
jgi:plasmid stabilization system protein ParE